MHGLGILGKLSRGSCNIRASLVVSGAWLCYSRVRGNGRTTRLLSSSKHTSKTYLARRSLKLFAQTEHIDNPKGYPDDARQYDSRLRGPVDVRYIPHTASELSGLRVLGTAA